MVKTNVVDVISFTDMFVSRAVIKEELKRGTRIDKTSRYSALHSNIRLRLT